MNMRALIRWTILVVTGFTGFFSFYASGAQLLGLPTGQGTLFYTFFLSIVSGVFLMTISELVHARFEISIMRRELNKLQEEAKNACVLLKTNTNRCPLGIVKITDKTEDTIKESILRASHNFKWLGLSAFNVLHNRQDLFRQKKTVRFEFHICEKDNKDLAFHIDNFYGDTKGKMGAEELMSKGDELLTKIKQDIHSAVEVRKLNQMPTFRVIVIDDRICYVSFYERGKDALDSMQLQIEDDPALPYNIFKWFPMFIEKTNITEDLIEPRK